MTWSVNSGRTEWDLRGASEYEVVRALGLLTVDHGGTITPSVGRGGTLELIFEFSARWRLRIRTPARYQLGDLQMVTGQTIKWTQQCSLGDAQMDVAMPSMEAADEMGVVLRMGRQFE
jgi:hypothetical protein